MRGLQLTNDNIARQVEEEAQTEKSAGIQRITVEISGQLGIAAVGDGERAEALDRAVKKLVDFIERGGEVDCIVPDAEPDQDEQQGDQPPNQLENLRQVREQFATIRTLENRIRALSHVEP